MTIMGITLAFATGGLGAFRLIRAAHGRPALTDVRDLAPRPLAEHAEALDSVRSLASGVRLAATCALLLVAAGGMTWYGPEKESQPGDHDAFRPDLWNHSPCRRRTARPQGLRRRGHGRSHQGDRPEGRDCLSSVRGEFRRREPARLVVARGRPYSTLPCPAAEFPFAARHVPSTRRSGPATRPGDVGRRAPAISEAAMGRTTLSNGR